MNETCTKAVIAVAGNGTRWLPATKALEKCMLPVGDRPVVDYVVDDCIQAGITDITFVVGAMSEQIRTYYGHNRWLERHLERQGNAQAAAALGEIASKATFHFVEQEPNQYGTTAALWAARNQIGADERFLFLIGDCFLWRPDGSSAMADFVNEANTNNLDNAMLVFEVPRDEVSAWGIVATEERDGREYFSHVQEKPKPEEAATQLANTGIYMLRGVWPHVERGLTHPGQERYFTDPLNWHHQAGAEIGVIRLNGEYLDTGTPQSWLQTNIRVAGVNQ
jgi:UTP--glucose-1-phosphate uridylyltransferase